MTNPEQPLPPSYAATIARALVGFPRYFADYLLGFYLVLVEVEMTTVLIVAILAGLVLGSVLVGLLVFFALWLLLRTLNSLATIVGQAIVYHARNPRE